MSYACPSGSSPCFLPSDKDVDVTVPTIRTRQPRGKASQEFHKRTDGSSDPGVHIRNLGPSEAESGVEFREANIALISWSLKGLGLSCWMASLSLGRVAEGPHPVSSRTRVQTLGRAWEWRSSFTAFTLRRHDFSPRNLS